MGQIYTVTHTQNVMYLDEGNNPIPGYKVRFILHEFGEGFDIDVPALDAEVVGARIKEVVENRRKLAKLGA